jgi:hypothetical protein
MLLFMGPLTALVVTLALLWDLARHGRYYQQHTQIAVAIIIAAFVLSCGLQAVATSMVMDWLLD